MSKDNSNLNIFILGLPPLSQQKRLYILLYIFKNCPSLFPLLIKGSVIALYTEQFSPFLTGLSLTFQCAVISGQTGAIGKWILKSCNDTNDFICHRNVGEPII